MRAVTRTPGSLLHVGGPRRPAIVIGAGFGGLALAMRLQTAGFQVTVIERREEVGGRAYRLAEKGYVFDMGPSLVTAPHLFASLFAVAGGSFLDEVDLIPLDPFYRIHFHDGTSIDYVGEPERMKAQMRRFHPGDADRFDDFMAAIRPIHEAIMDGGLGATPFDSLRTMLGFIPRMVRLGAHRSAAGFVSRFFEDPRHRFLYSFHPLFVGGSPFEVPAVYLMIPWLEREGGVWFARGGMYSIVEAMERRLVALGATIRTGEEVREIVVENGRATGVRTDHGLHSAEFVVSNADVAHTYRDLVPRAARRRWSDRRLARLDYSMSCFLIYLGVRGEYPGLAHHTLVLSERYRSLLRDIFERKVLPDDFSLYLHAPTRTDPSMAPPGCESLYALVPVANNRSGIDWKSAAAPYANRILRFLEDWGLPGLRSRIEVMKIFTPDDFERELNATHGNAFSLEPRLAQTGWFRPHNRSEEVEGLYLVGAGTHPGAGVPGVLLSAEATASAMVRDAEVPAR